MLERAWLGDGAAAGLIALSGGREGDVGRALLAGRVDEAQRLLDDWLGLFGDCYYLEIQRSGRPGEEEHIRGVLGLLAERSVPVVATNDVRFLTPGEFERRVCEGDFLEHATVHGNRYGTLKETVRSSMASGRSVLMDIDVQGAAQIRAHVATREAGAPLHAGFVFIFIEPPSLDAFRRRLEGRAEDAPDVIERRLRQAAEEMARRGEYRHRIVNDDLDRAYAAFRACVLEERGAPLGLRATARLTPRSRRKREAGTCR
jgi:guanylate kinase